MKKLVFLLFLMSCGLQDADDRGTGKLRLSFTDVSEALTRSGGQFPDTSDFLLTINASSGKTVYDGVFGACPEEIDLPAGSYDVRVVSGEFSKPAFDAPQYGDEKCIVVPSGGVADVRLVCSQLNSGVRLDIDESFLTSCPDGTLHLSSPDGRLLYTYREERIAYFLPGQVSLMLSQGGRDQVLLTRNLQPRQVLNLGVSSAQSSSGSAFQGIGGVSVSVDTSRFWLDDEYVIGGSSDKGKSWDDAFTVAHAISNAPKEDVWVSGYVVGGDLTSTSASFGPPFKSRTNVLVGPRSSTTERSSCISVQLPAGKVRDAVNLVDNPDMLGRKVCLKGDLVESYFGLVGLKNTDDMSL